MLIYCIPDICSTALHRGFSINISSRNADTAPSTPQNQRLKGKRRIFCEHRAFRMDELPDNPEMLDAIGEGVSWFLVSAPMLTFH